MGENAEIDQINRKHFESIKEEKKKMNEKEMEIEIDTDDDKIEINAEDIANYSPQMRRKLEVYMESVLGMDEYVQLTQPQQLQKGSGQWDILQKERGSLIASLLKLMS